MRTSNRTGCTGLNYRLTGIQEFGLQNKKSVQVVERNEAFSLSMWISAMLWAATRVKEEGENGRIDFMR